MGRPPLTRTTRPGTAHEPPSRPGCNQDEGGSTGLSWEFVAAVWESAPSTGGVEVSLRHEATAPGGIRVDLRRARVFPDGVELAVRLSAEAQGSPARPPSEWRQGVELEVVFADGRSANLLDSAGMKSGRGPMLGLRSETTWSGGAVGALRARFWLWVWPLPPDGPLTVRIGWPVIGMGDVEFALDAADLRRALGPAPGHPSPSPVASKQPEPSVPAPPEPTPPRPLPDVGVPSLIGMGVRSARIIVEAAGLFLEHPDPDGPPLASGRVVRQEPQAGRLVPPFSRVVAWVTGEDEPPPGNDGTPPPDDPWPDQRGPGGWGPGPGGRPPSGDREPRRPTPPSGVGALRLEEPE